jgi:outer membrane receptor protein involved in Fe transport
MRIAAYRWRRHPGHRAAVLALLTGLLALPALAAQGDDPRDVQLAQAQPDDTTAEEPSSEAPQQATPGGDESEPPTNVEVLRVRGRGAGAIETDVPSSVTQFDASTIEALGAQDISALSRVTPNVNIVQPGATQATFFVRGIGLQSFDANATGAVTIFQDDVALDLAAIQTGQLYDVEGVDVVRGPQGSGAFRNASAGAISVRSRRPTGSGYNAYLRSSIGEYDTKGGDKGARHAMIQDYEGALEMPLADEGLSSRFAFRLRDAEPYRTNGCGDAIPFEQRLPKPTLKQQNQQGITLDSRDICGERGLFSWPDDQISRIPVGLPRAVDDEHNWAARGTFRFQPPDTDVELFLNAHGSRLDQNSALGQAVGVFPLAGGNQDVPDVSSIRFAGKSSQSAGGYIDADVKEEFGELCGPTAYAANGDISKCANQFVNTQIAKRVAGDRPLDKRPYRGDYDRVGQTTRDAWGGFVSGAAPVFGNTKLFMLASYDTYDRSIDQDTDFTPDRLFETVQQDEAWQTYLETRLDGELSDEPVQWQAGGYYLGEHLSNTGTTFLSQDINLDRDWKQRVNSLGLWGQFSWDFSDDFTLEGGVRYNYERKNFEFLRQQSNGGVVIPSASGTVKQEHTWQTPTGQLILTYHMTENTSAYARYTRGFKAGHFNALATENLNEPPADAEYNDAWETGLRGSWLDSRLSLASSFFYYRYENYQVFLFIDSADAGAPPVLEILNAHQAENYGIELEGMIQPLRGWTPKLIEGLRLSGNFSWLHGEYIDFSTTRTFRLPNSAGPVDVTVDFSGNQLQNSPQYKVSATAEWTFDLGRWGSIIPRYDVNWSDDVFFDPNEGRGTPNSDGSPGLPRYAVGQKAYFLHNARLTYRTPTGNVELAGWVRNIEDQVYKNYAFDASRFTGIVINFPGEPRSVGVDFTITF